MKARVLLTTVVSFLLLLAVVAAGLNAVFTVTLVEAEFSVFSEEGGAEAEAIKEKLDGFVGSSTTFLDLADLRAEAEKYPCMRVDVLEKQYPSTVKISISERKENFVAAREAGGYAVFDEEGCYLYDKETNVNRAGGENIELGFETPLETGAPGEKAAGEDFDACLFTVAVFAQRMVQVRAFVKSIAYVHSPTHDTLKISMREGISIEIVDPAQSLEAKALAALDDGRYGYFARPAEERGKGTITVTGSAYGDSVNVDYDQSRG